MMKKAMVGLVCMLVVLAAGAAAQQREVIDVEAIPAGDVPELIAVEGFPGFVSYDTCNVGNLGTPVYAITDWLYGYEGYKIYVDPWTCPCPAPEHVMPLAVTMYIYAYDTIGTCGSFQMQADVQTAAGTPTCPVPGDEICWSAVYNVAIPSAGLWYITLPIEDCFCQYEPFFISWWFLDDGGCLPGPLTVVTDASPMDCDSYVNYRGFWEDLVADYGFPGVISMYATVECREDPSADERGTWGRIKSIYR
jgi:hypothetical protein